MASAKTLNIKQDQVLLNTDEYLDMELNSRTTEKLKAKEKKRTKDINYTDATAFWFCFGVLIVAGSFGVRSTVLNQLTGLSGWAVTAIAVAPFVYIILKNRRKTLA